MSKVSIIIPCYNHGKYIKEAVMSAVNQTYSDIEIICINDGSIDNTAEIIQKLTDKYNNITFLDNKENKGVIYSRNFAIKNCDSEYILPLDADDTIEPTYIEKAVKILDKNTNIGIVYCSAKFFGTINKTWDLPKFDKDKMLYANMIFATAMFRKSDYLKAGGYNSNMQNGCEDWDLWLSFLELGIEVYKINEVLFNYRQYKEESRTNICTKNIYEVIKQIIKNHFDLYLNDKQFLDKVILFDAHELKKKYKKYKKIYNILLPINIIETIVIFVLLVVKYFR